MGFLFPMTGVTFPFTNIPNLLITAKAFPLRKSCRPWSLYVSICVFGHLNLLIRQPPYGGFFCRNACRKNSVQNEKWRKTRGFLQSANNQESKGFETAFVSYCLSDV